MDGARSARGAARRSAGPLSVRGRDGGARGRGRNPGDCRPAAFAAAATEPSGPGFRTDAPVGRRRALSDRPLLRDGTGRTTDPAGGPSRALRLRQTPTAESLSRSAGRSVRAAPAHDPRHLRPRRAGFHRPRQPRMPVEPAPRHGGLAPKRGAAKKPTALAVCQRAQEPRPQGGNPILLVRLPPPKRERAHGERGGPPVFRYRFAAFPASRTGQWAACLLLPRPSRGAHNGMFPPSPRRCKSVPGGSSNYRWTLAFPEVDGQRAGARCERGRRRRSRRGRPRQQAGMSARVRDPNFGAVHRSRADLRSSFPSDPALD